MREVRYLSAPHIRIAVKSAFSGTTAYPESGDLSISARSSTLGDPIMPGSPRFYQAYYRDPVASFCPSPMGDNWNVSNAVRVDW